MDQSLVEFVTKLKNLNDIEVEIPKANIKAIIEDPLQYAKDFIEVSFAKLGKAFGKKLNDGSKVQEEL